MILIVSYDLKSVKDYTPLFDAIKRQGEWCHYLASTWFISTTKTVDVVYQELLSHIDSKDDRIFVGTLASGYEGWLAKDAWEWLRSRGLNSR